MTRTKTHLLHTVLLVAAIAFAFARIFGAGFMNWDDLDYVFNTRDISSGIGTTQIKNWFTHFYLGNYQPLPVASYALDHLLAGPDPFVFHVHSLLWHVLATILVYRFISKLQGDLHVAFFVALLFAVHPVQTESVSWIAARNKSMNAVFFLASMCAYISYAKTGINRKLIWVTLFGVLAYLCKATAISLPLALFACDIWMQRKLRTRKILLEKVPLVLAAIPVAYVTLAAQKEVEFLQHHSGFGWDNIVLAGYAFIRYLGNLLLPVQLSVLYPYPATISFVHVIFMLFALAVTALIFIAYFRKSYKWSGGLLFFAVNLLPVLQLVQFGETLMADRYLYIACLGIFYPLADSLLRLRIRARPAGPVICTVICVLLITLTFRRNAIWLSEITFWKAILEKFPESGVAHYSIGAAYMKTGELEKAETHMDRAVRYEPQNHKAWRNKGSLHLAQGKMNEALIAFNISIELRPYVKAYFSRAMLYQKLSKYALALQDLREVIKLQPDNARAYYLMGLCESQLGKKNEALSDFNNAILREPGEALFHLGRGIEYARNGSRQLALRDFDRAVTLNAGNGEAFYYRAMTNYSLGRDPCPDLFHAIKKGYAPAKTMMEKICR